MDRRRYGKRKPRKDANHTEIQREVELAFGIENTVDVTAIPKLYDIQTSFRGYVIPIEIKTLTGDLTKDEADYHKVCGFRIWIVRTKEQVWKLRDIYMKLPILDLTNEKI